MTIPDRMLRQFMAGALDPPEQEQVERALAAEPALWARLVELRQTTVPEPIGWFLPPPGARPLGVGGHAAPVAVMDGGAATGWLVLRLEVAPAHLDHRVVVLERHGADWNVGFPASAEEVLTAGALPREGDRVRIDYAPGGAGPGRIAVVLVPPDLGIDWDAPVEARWAGVREALAAGALPAVSFALGAPGS